MMPFFVWNVPFFQECSVFCGDFSSVRKKNVESFHFRKDCGARAAFASAKYNYSLVFVHIISTFFCCCC